MNRISVTVVCALPDRQDVAQLDLPVGTTAIEAVRASGLAAHHPGIDPSAGKLGVFGRVVAPETILADGDRVEIYRPLAIDPRIARRARAARARAGRFRR